MPGYEWWIPWWSSVSLRSSVCISQSHRIRKSSSQRSLSFDSFVPSKVTFEGKKNKPGPCACGIWKLWTLCLRQFSKWAHTVKVACFKSRSVCGRIFDFLQISGFLYPFLFVYFNFLPTWELEKSTNPLNFDSLPCGLSTTWPTYLFLWIIGVLIEKSKSWEKANYMFLVITHVHDWIRGWKGTLAK